MNDQIKCMNEFADAMEKKDEAKAKEAKEKLDETVKKLDELKLSDDEKKKLMERHADDFGKAMARMLQAGMKGAMGNFGEMLGKGVPSIPGASGEGKIAPKGK